MVDARMERKSSLTSQENSYSESRKCRKKCFTIRMGEGVKLPFILFSVAFRTPSSFIISHRTHPLLRFLYHLQSPDEITEKEMPRRKKRGSREYDGHRRSNYASHLPRIPSLPQISDPASLHMAPFRLRRHSPVIRTESKPINFSLQAGTRIKDLYPTVSKKGSVESF
jgi:hypothetical protein